MIDLIAKRYVKALLSDKDVKKNILVCDELKEISLAFNDEKFLSIISSTEIKNLVKVDFIISLISNISLPTKNLLKLLGENKRLDIIPNIYSELERQISELNNNYTGIIHTKTLLDDNYVNSIKDRFSKKFNIDLVLKQNVGTYDGIKVDIEGLGVEISFSKERLKSQMIDHILKAV